MVVPQEATLHFHWLSKHWLVPLYVELDILVKNFVNSRLWTRTLFRLYHIRCNPASGDCFLLESSLHDHRHLKFENQNFYFQVRYLHHQQSIPENCGRENFPLGKLLTLNDRKRPGLTGLASPDWPRNRQARFFIIWNGSLKRQKWQSNEMFNQRKYSKIYLSFIWTVLVLSHVLRVARSNVLALCLVPQQRPSLYPF